MLLVAAIAGLAATALAFLYIQSATNEIEEVVPPQTLKVLFAIEDLAPNSIIDAQKDLREETIVIDSTPGLARAAVKASERAAVDGRPISSPVPAGVPLLYAHLTEIKDVNIGAGMRAMAISVTAESLMGGILVPGDHVDILVSYQMEEKEEKVEPTTPDANDGGAQAAITDMMGAMMGQLGSLGGSVPSEWVTEDVLLDVRIIAVGSALSGSRQAQLFGLSGGSGRSSTVTLEITPAQARELVRVQAGGRNPLTLLLRPEDTSGESATSSLTGG